VIIMTSNIGSQYLLEGSVAAGGGISESARNSVLSELRQKFRPEFLNRVDDTILFAPLSMEQIKTIVDLLVTGIRRRLSERRIGLELTDAAKEHAAEAGFDPVYGARPLKRFLQRELETQIGRAIIGGKVNDGDRIRVDASDDGFVLKIQSAAQAEQAQA
jgi:ATP-dependent Clp protease ATP-binding subunit ClpB